MIADITRALASTLGREESGGEGEEERRAERRARREEKDDAWLAANRGMRKYLSSRLVHKYRARRAAVDGQIKQMLINI